MAKRHAGSGKQDDEPAPQGRDVALILRPTDDRKGLHVVRRRGEEQPLELGTVRPLEEGRPIEGEVVSLRPRQEAPFVCDVKTELPAPRRLTGAGPPQVATDEYRRGWDAIFNGGGAQKPN